MANNLTNGLVNFMENEKEKTCPDCGQIHDVPTEAVKQMSDLKDAIHRLCDAADHPDFAISALMSAVFERVLKEGIEPAQFLTVCIDLLALKSRKKKSEILAETMLLLFPGQGESL